MAQITVEWSQYQRNDPNTYEMGQITVEWSQYQRNDPKL